MLYRVPPENRRISQNTVNIPDMCSLEYHACTSYYNMYITVYIYILHVYIPVYMSMHIYIYYVYCIHYIYSYIHIYIHTYSNNDVITVLFL